MFKKLIKNNPLTKPLKWQKSLADKATKEPDRYKAPPIDPEVKRLADEQLKRSTDYRSNMGNARSEQFGQAEQKSRRGLAESMYGNKANYSGRGLLFSGMKAGGDIDAQTESADALADTKAGINVNLENTAQDFDEKALGSRMQLAQMENANANMQQQMDLAHEKEQSSIGNRFKRFGSKLLSGF